MKIGAGVQAVLRFCLRNLRGCNVGITIYEVGRQDRFMYHDIHTKNHEYFCKVSSNIKVLPQKSEWV
jgi:hypothetical protein